MKVYALVGSSGTGKSYKAMRVLKEHDIDMIIDDGLLILGTKVVAGSSAKKERTKIGAIKRALFSEEDHIKDAQKAIAQYRPTSILILGTSQGMVKKIQEKLELPPIGKFIFIEEISQKWEMEKARDIRKREGKHVIPVPAFEVKKHFSGYFLDPLKIFRKNSGNKREEVEEKTVVRPTFSYLGNYTIADTVISSVVQYIALENEAIKKIGRIYIHSQSNGMIIQADITLHYGVIIPEVVEELQRKITKELDYMTGQNILEVNIYVRK